MNSDQLRNFRTIAQSGNLTRAAEKLFISQPALSMSLTKLEDELGRQLFIRKGKTMELTESGEKLLNYANIVVDAIEEAAALFRAREENEPVTVYRIGGTAASLLMSGSYNISNLNVKIQLIHNRDLPRVMAQNADAVFIADERYMKNVSLKGMEKELLYRQRLLLSVRGGDPQAALERIDVSELKSLSLVGRSGAMGFNDWISDIKEENGCEINEVTHSDYILFATEGSQITQPFLMNSFGESVASHQSSFAGRKNIPVTGKYTERDIYLWYGTAIKKRAQPIIQLIKRNAGMVNQADLMLYSARDEAK